MGVGAYLFTRGINEYMRFVVVLFVSFLCIQPSPKQGTIPDLIIHCTHFLNYDTLESERKRGGR